MQVLFNHYLVPVLILSLIVYWKLRVESLRDAWLSTVSLAVLFYIHPLFSVSILIISISFYRLGEQVRSGMLDKKEKLITYALGCGVLFILVGKYGVPFIASFFQGSSRAEKFYIVPLGLSYFAFRLIQYGFDSYRGLIARHTFWKFLAFLSFIPTLPAGPLESFQGFSTKRSASFDSNQFVLGIGRIFIGYFKKVVLLDFLFIQFFDPLMISATTGNEAFLAQGPWLAFASLVAFFLRAYLDLSAYTDLALGYSSLFGFRLMENFNFPFFAPNLIEFWRRWHISLSLWCRNTVYFPVLGRSQKPAISLFASMLVMGLWHQLNLNWFFWAVFHTVGLITVIHWHRYKRKRLNLARIVDSAWLRPVGILLTFMYVSLGYAFVSLDTPEHALKWILLSVQGIITTLSVQVIT